MIQKFVSFLRNFALCFWLGELLFFGAIFAPRVFKVLDRPDAAQLQASLFPPYYLVAFICGLMVLLSVLIQKRILTKTQYYLGIIIGFAGSAVSAVSLWYITPTLIGLYPAYYSQNPPPEAIAQFAQLHKISVSSNVTIMLLLIVLVFALSERPTKRLWT